MYRRLFASLTASLILIPYFVYSLVNLSLTLSKSGYCNEYCREVLSVPVFYHYIVLNITKLNLPQGNVNFLVADNEITSIKWFDSNSVSESQLQTKTVTLEPYYQFFLPSTQLEGLQGSQFYNFSAAVANAIKGSCVGFIEELPNAVSISPPGCLVQLEFEHKINATFTVLAASDTQDAWYYLVVLEVENTSQPVLVYLTFNPDFARKGAIGAGVVGFLVLIAFVVFQILCLKELCNTVKTSSDCVSYLTGGCCEDVMDEYSES